MSSPRPTFKTWDREQLYEFIDARDGVTYEELVAADLLTDPDRYRQPVAVMKRDGLLTEVDGELRAAVDATGADSHRIDSEFFDEVMVAVAFG